LNAVAIVAGEELQLLPQRAAYWKRKSTLLVADAHFGKAAAFRAGGIPVPHGTTAETIERIDSSLRETAAERIIFLGDFLHAPEGRSEAMLRAVAEWRGERAAVEMVLVRGNHDRRAGDPPGELRLECVDAPMLEGPFAFTHHPVALAGAYVLAGHIHPAVRLSGRDRQRARLPCFWFGSQGGVLPACGEFTGMADIEPAEGDQLWVIAEKLVLRV